MTDRIRTQVRQRPREIASIKPVYDAAETAMFENKGFFRRSVENA